MSDRHFTSLAAFVGITIAGAKLATLAPPAVLFQRTPWPRVDGHARRMRPVMRLFLRETPPPARP